MTEEPTNFRDVLKEFDKTAGLAPDEQKEDAPEPGKKPKPPDGNIEPEKGFEPPTSRKKPPKEGWDEVADDEFG